MATQKKRAKATRNKKVTDVNEHQNLVYTLGDEQSELQYEAAISDESVYRLKYGEPVNMFALVHPEFILVQEHWLKIGKDTYRVVCKVHDTNDPHKIANKWGFPEGCEFCAIKQRLYEEAPKDSKDAIDIRKRKIAKDVQAKASYYLYAIKGEGDTKRLRGKKIIEPFFENFIVRKLQLTKDAFDKFYTAYKEFKEQGFTSKDIIGLPVNFAGGTNEGGFTSIQSVEFYPKFKIKLSDIPDVPKTFGALDLVNSEQIDELLEKWNADYPKMLAGRSAKESKGKSKGKKTKVKNNAKKDGQDKDQKNS